MFQAGTAPDAMEELMSCVRNGTKLLLTSFNSHVGKATQDVGELMSKLWLCDVVAVGNNSSRDTRVLDCGLWSVVKDEVSVDWE